MGGEVANTMPARRAAGVPYAIAAAALFGASTPVAKLLVGHVDPLLLASVLYLGSGLGLGVVWLVRVLRRIPAREAPLSRADLPWLAGATLAGGVCGPILLMVGLSLTPGTAASLLLNMEGVFTALIAWLVFRENADARVVLGMAAIIAGGVVLSGATAGGVHGPLGPLAVAGACLAWGIDNNLTRKVSGGDPVQVACVKGGVAGLVNLAIAFAGGVTAPHAASLAAAAAVGFLGYGVSLALFVLSLRHLGTARTGAYFSTAPFLGAALAVPLLQEPLAGSFALAFALMGIGVWLHLTENHDHLHEHADLMHEHRHHHDPHHAHEHGRLEETSEPHSHPHLHGALSHSHHHYPDLHHAHYH
jgi:drug/metabolite transporter (DMT)-like permease